MPRDPADPATLDDLDAADPLAVAFAVRRGGDRLRTAAWDPADLQAFVAKLRVLAKDPNARIRQSVAEAAPHLPEAAFQEILPPLTVDRSPFVRDAAERSERKRSALRRTATCSEGASCEQGQSNICDAGGTCIFACFCQEGNTVYCDTGCS